jgi:hypothetical protein
MSAINCRDPPILNRMVVVEAMERRFSLSGILVHASIALRPSFLSYEAGSRPTGLRSIEVH